MVARIEEPEKMACLKMLYCDVNEKIRIRQVKVILVDLLKVIQTLFKNVFIKSRGVDSRKYVLQLL